LITNNILETSTKGLKELGLFSSIVGHLGDGNFHEAIMYHKDDPVEAAAVDKHIRDMIVKALEMEGTSTVSLLFLSLLMLLISMCRANIQSDSSRRVNYSRKLDLIL
jgi:hypothetical protein